MFILQLNPMTQPTEVVESVAWADTAQELVAYLDREKSILPYQDGFYMKTFKPGSKLEWFNPPSKTGTVGLGVNAIVDVGTLESWIQETTANWYNTRSTLFHPTNEKEK